MLVTQVAVGISIKKITVIYYVCVCVCVRLSADAWYYNNIWRHSRHYLIQSDTTDSPPPCIWQRYGNRHTLPSPTAYDTQASTNCRGLSQLGLVSFSMTPSLEDLLVFLNSWNLGRQECVSPRASPAFIKSRCSLRGRCQEEGLPTGEWFVLWNTYASLLVKSAV